MAKAVYDNKLLECYFTRSFYKHILGKPVKYQDMESEDLDFAKSLGFVLENPIEDVGSDLFFCMEVCGVTIYVPHRLLLWQIFKILTSRV